MTTIDRRYSVAEGTAIKAPCAAATTAAITLAGEQTVNGVAVAETSPPTRVLVKDQAAGADNGIYDVSTGNWTRARDCDGAFDLVTGTLVKVTSGTNAGFWELMTTGAITVGTTALTWSNVSNAIAGVSSFAQMLLAQTTAGDFLAAIGDVLALLGETGSIKIWGKSTVPSGYLACDGAAVSRTTYAALFAAIGTTFGAGDGATTFNVPDLRGRAPVGLEAVATRLTIAGCGINGATLGAAGGAETHTLTTSQLPVHHHAATGLTVTGANGAITVSSSNINVGAGGDVNVRTGASSVTPTWIGSVGGATADEGAGGGHANVQPSLVINFIIKI